MIPRFKRLSFDILSFFLNSYNASIEKIEEDLCEVRFFIIFIAF